MTRRVEKRKSRRRVPDRRVSDKEVAKMIDDLMMQARCTIAANRMMKVEPREVERTLEYRAAEMLKRFAA